MAASVMNYHGSSNLRLTGGITKSRTKIVSRLEMANPKKLKSARKMLFGPVDGDETRRIVETQLKKHVLEASSRWDFDFTTDQPIRSPESKYVWERISRLDHDRLTSSSSSSRSPGPLITLTSAAHIRPLVATADLSPSCSSSCSSACSSANSSLVSSPSTSICLSDLETDTERVVHNNNNSKNRADLNAAVEGGSSSNDGAAKRMVQKKMTDFMKEKKRTNAVLATAAKKRDFAGISTAAGATATAAMVATSEDLSSGCSWGEMPPAKRMRTGSAASSCSSVGSSS